MIRGVKVLGLESRNGRTYLPEALAQAAPLYEDAKVNVNHPKGNPGGPRDYQDRIGTIRHVPCRPGEGLVRRLPLQSQARLGGTTDVGRRARAGERGLFAQRRGAGGPARRPGGGRSDHPRAKRRPGGRPGHDARPVRVGGDNRGRPTPRDDAEPATLDDLKRDYPEVGREHSAGSRRPRSAGFKQEVDRLTALEAIRQKRSLARRLLREFDLPEPDAADPWAKTVVSQPVPGIAVGGARRASDARPGGRAARLVRTLADGDGRARPRRARPQSRDQHLVYAAGASDAKSFVEAIT